MICYVSTAVYLNFDFVVTKCTEKKMIGLTRTQLKEYQWGMYSARHLNNLQVTIKRINKNTHPELFI